MIVALLVLGRLAADGDGRDGGLTRRTRTARAARDRARALLRLHLDAVQRAELDTTHSFIVTAPSGHRYRIATRVPFNVHDETAGIDYCVQFVDENGFGLYVPVEDLMLAQKILLETDEHEFLSIANKRRVEKAA